MAADAAAPVRRDALDGPLGETRCQPVRRSDVDPAAPVFSCLVERGQRGVYDRALLTGYRFRGRLVLDTHRVGSRACTG